MIWRFLTAVVLLAACGLRMQEDSGIKSVGSSGKRGYDYVLEYMPQHLLNVYGIGNASAFCDARAAMGINYDECKHVLLEGYRQCLNPTWVYSDWGLCMNKAMNDLLAASTSYNRWSVNIGAINKTGMNIIASNLYTFANYLYGQDLSDPDDALTTPAFGPPFCGINQSCKGAVLEAYRRCLSEQNIFATWDYCAFVDINAFAPSKNNLLIVVPGTYQSLALNRAYAGERKLGLTEECITDHYCKLVCKDNVNYQLVSNTKNCDERNPDDNAKKAACYVAMVQYAQPMIVTPYDPIPDYIPPPVFLTKSELVTFDLYIEAGNEHNEELIETIVKRVGGLESDLVETVMEPIFDAGTLRTMRILSVTVKEDENPVAQELTSSICNPYQYPTDPSPQPSNPSPPSTPYPSPSPGGGYSSPTPSPPPSGGYGYPSPPSPSAGGYTWPAPLPTPPPSWGGYGTPSPSPPSSGY